MSPALSLYLDAVRIGAALFVVYAHSNLRFLLPAPLPLAEFGHSAVVVFFVLSGYVIAYVAEGRERDGIDYAAARISRIVPLALVSVLAALAADHLGRQLAPALYQVIPADRVLLRLALSAAFLNETWWLSVMPFSNVPYWSLCYEVVYYLLFGIALHAPPGWRGPALALVALLAGPKILLLLPCWLLGVAACRYRGDARWPAGLAAALWLGSAGLFWLHHRLDLMRGFADGLLAPRVSPWLMEHLAFSRYFAADVWLAGVVALNFIAARRLLTARGAPAAGLRNAAARLGMLTFAIYILHFPLLYLAGALLTGLTPGPAKWALVVTGALLAAVTTGALVDRSRPGLRRWLVRLGRQALAAAPARGSSRLT
jgi:peptidoglycan/LPS O-acetylase OafA/YrhL